MAPTSVITEKPLIVCAKRQPERPLLPDLFTNLEWGWFAEQFELSRRQAEIARLICRGCTNEAIADRLRLSEGTVRVYTDGLYKRIGVQSRLALLVQFVDTMRRANGNTGSA